MSLSRAASLFAAAVISAGALGCKGKPEALGPTDEELVVAQLRVDEKATRASTDFARQPSSNRLLGADPYVILALPPVAREASAPSHEAARFVGLLRNSERVVVLDANLHELARAEAPRLASALTVTQSGEILAGGEGSAEVSRCRFALGRIETLPAIDLRGDVPTRGIRALASHPSGAIFAVDEANDALVVARPDGAQPLALPTPAGPFRIVVTTHFAVVASLIGHAISVFRLDSAGMPEGAPTLVRHDGPIWSIAAEEHGADLVVAAGGVEDHPLDRTGGSFAYVDSYVYLYRFGNTDTTQRLQSIDVGERGLITPKALAFTEGGAKLWVTGYGSPRAITFEWAESSGSVDYAKAPKETSFSLPPGSASIAPFDDSVMAIANPLLDAWVMASMDHADVVRAAPDLRALPRSDASMLGEALFFTNLMSPWAKSDGPLSRFTCETCHFEGAVDGRTHATGRGDIVATTKPLLGLFNNAPHFTRALDKDTSGMVDAEFRVASQNTGHSPWFSLSDAVLDPHAFGGLALDDPQRTWFRELPMERSLSEASPKDLRNALTQFLFDFSPRPNPAVFDRDRYSPIEALGARVFEQRCASCHAARLVTDDPSSSVPFERWERLIFGAAPDLAAGSIVWARDGYEKTGVEPYVSADGARPTSLRRLARKRPYFTNGSAPSVADVLERVRFSGDKLFHDAKTVEPSVHLDALTSDERAALLSFLSLL